MESTASEPLTDKPVVDESVTEGAQHSGHSVSSRQRRIIIASVIAAVLVLACGVTGGVYAYQQHEHSQAVKACTASLKPLQQALSRLSAVQSAKNTTDMVKLDVKKLADTSTHDKLVNAVKPVSVSVASCEKSLPTDKLRAREKANKRAVGRVESAQARVVSAVNAVSMSRTVKSRTVLVGLVKSARAVVKDSTGKVQEGKTVESLNSVISVADKLTQDKTADYSKLDKQATDLQKAIDSVKASVEAKRKADEEAARKAEEERQAQAAAAAAAQAAQQAQTYRAPSQSYQQPTQNTPQQAAPQHKLGGNFGSVEKCPPQGCVQANCDGQHYCPLG